MIYCAIFVILNGSSKIRKANIKASFIDNIVHARRCLRSLVMMPYFLLLSPIISEQYRLKAVLGVRTILKHKSVV